MKISEYKYSFSRMTIAPESQECLVGEDQLYRRVNEVRWLAEIFHSVPCKRVNLQWGVPLKHTMLLPSLHCLGDQWTLFTAVALSMALFSMAKVRASPVILLVSWLSSFHYSKSGTKDSPSTTSLALFCSLITASLSYLPVLYSNGFTSFNFYSCRWFFL